MYDHLEIKFRSRKLEKAFRSKKERVSRWGEAVAEKFILRIQVLQAILCLEDLRQFSFLRFHSLKGSRKGQYAVDIHDRWRLVFTLQEDEDGGEAILILEVSNHYGD